MTDHTPELTAMGDKIYGETPEDGIIARVYGDEDLATRFVAAYNACAGIPTKQLKDGSFRLALERLVDRFETRISAAEPGYYITGYDLGQRYSRTAQRDLEEARTIVHAAKD